MLTLVLCGRELSASHSDRFTVVQIFPVLIEQEASWVLEKTEICYRVCHRNHSCDCILYSWYKVLYDVFNFKSLAVVLTAKYNIQKPLHGADICDCVLHMDLGTNSDFVVCTALTDWLCITKVESVYCAVRVESVYKTDNVSSLNVLKSPPSPQPLIVLSEELHGYMFRPLGVHLQVIKIYKFKITVAT